MQATLHHSWAHQSAPQRTKRADEDRNAHTQSAHERNARQYSTGLLPTTRIVLASTKCAGEHRGCGRIEKPHAAPRQKLENKHPIEASQHSCVEWSCLADPAGFRYSLHLALQQTNTGTVDAQSDRAQAAQRRADECQRPWRNNIPLRLRPWQQSAHQRCDTNTHGAQCSGQPMHACRSLHR
jgi:hypothetical protein